MEAHGVPNEENGLRTPGPRMIGDLTLTTFMEIIGEGLVHRLTQLEKKVSIRPTCGQWWQKVAFPMRRPDSSDRTTGSRTEGPDGDQDTNN